MSRFRVADLWASVRPRTRRGAAVATAGIVGGAAFLAVAIYAGLVLSAPYLEVSLQPEANARSWAALKPEFGASSSCGRCHEPEAQKAAAASHEGIGCQSCHGPLLDHSLVADASPGDADDLAVPTDELCVSCHVAVVGRPDSVRQIVPADHYVAECLQCHDPHTGISRPPMVVLHPLDRLPACVTCHGPEGFKARNQRHPDVGDRDAECLACHAAGSGPGQIE
jgi:hypothetical protein